MPLETIIGLIVLFFSMIFQVIFPPLPAELIVISAGKLYGVLATTIVASAGLYVGSFVAYLLGSYAHRTFDRFFEQDKIKKIITALKRYESAILWVRILPYNPSDVISYAAGILHFDKRRFLTIGLVTSVVRCFLLAWLGAFITSLKTLAAVLVVLLCSLLLAHFLLFRKK